MELKFVLAMLAAVPFRGAASGTARDADRSALVAGERAWGQAYVAGDSTAARRLLADDFHGIDTSGAAYDKRQAIMEIETGPHSQSDRVDVIAVHFYGDTAVIQAHEFVEGPLPEAHPSDRVFSDTWIKRGGRWQIVAAEDMKVGLPTLPQYQEDISAIRALRDANNRAITAHDLAAFLPMFADDAVFTWSNGSSAVGKAALKGFFASDFADPNFTTYVRTPASISVSDPRRSGDRARQLDRS
jgi:hypothetical protein